MIINVFVLDLLGIAVSVFYLILVAIHWWAVLLLAVCILYFLCAFYPTVCDVFCGSFSVIDDLRH
jgi:hypothetical protein